MLPQVTGGEPTPRWEDYDLSETYQTPLGELKIIKTYPYGFRKLVLTNGGKLPEEYIGDYTTPSVARQMKDKLIKEYENVTPIKRKK